MLHRLCWSNKICNHDSFFQKIFFCVICIFFNHFNSFLEKLCFTGYQLLPRPPDHFEIFDWFIQEKNCYSYWNWFCFAFPVFDSILKKNRFKTKVWSLVHVSMNYWIYFHILFFFNFYFPVPRRSPTAVHFFHLITLFKQSLNDWVT